ncbi:hypothetical protein [Streptomyces sp. NPDC051561]|uniref:hypothetical protein n=1 Tax=Streptomyces sp. NPDC051561 TaxID=3365658 RepID=UPI0037B48E43
MCKRAERLETPIEEARSELLTAEESLLFNPLRIVGRSRNRARTHATFHGYTAVFAALDEDLLGEQTQTLGHLVTEARRRRREAAEEAEHRSLPLIDPTRPYGVLIVEATRLAEELQHTSDVLKEHVRG